MHPSIYNDRNNPTPQAEYDWISTDTGVAAPRTNLPYSFTHKVWSIDGAYPLTTAIRLYAGCSIDEFKRDLQEVEYTNEGSCWGKAGIQAKDNRQLHASSGRTRSAWARATRRIPMALRHRIR